MLAHDKNNLTQRQITREIETAQERLAALEWERREVNELSRDREDLLTLADEAAKRTKNEQTIRKRAAARSALLALDRRARSIAEQCRKLQEEIAELNAELMSYMEW